VDPAAPGPHGTELQLAQAFVGSAEFTERYGSLNSNASLSSDGAAGTVFLQALYANVLGRTGSAAEINAWLATGETTAQVLVGFSDSAEFQERANEPTLTYLTDESAILGHTPAYTGNLFQF
jgi:hypothetical protein